MSTCFSNSYAATGLNAGTEYQFYVTSAGDTGESAPSNVLMASTPFEAPTVDVEGSGTVVEGQPYQLDLSADYPDGEPGGIDHYQVDWNDGPAGSSNVISYSYPAGADVTQPLTVSHVFNAGIASPKVTVTAVDLINGSFVADAQPVTVTPVSPTNLSVSASGSSLNVAWVNASSISTGTTVLLSTDGETFFDAGTAAAGAIATFNSKTKPKTRLDGHGLDNNFPYTTGKSAADGPQNGDPSGTLTSLIFFGEFNMVLMWQPPSINGSYGPPVPLQIVNWTTEASDKLVGKMWNLTFTVTKNPKAKDTINFPTWKSIFINAT